jgi:signal transduction histidine kinase
MSQLTHQFISKTTLDDQQRLYSAAHDIASPLAALQICLNAIKELTPSETWKIMNSAIMRIRGISRDIESQRTHATEAVKLVDIINQTLSEKYLEWSESPCSIEINIDQDTKNYSINVESAGMCRMLSNLLNNAYESMNENPHIILSLRLQDSFIVLGIQDLGHGIDEDQIHLMINGYSTKHTGQGLGLSNATRYMSSLRGKLQIKSERGRGTLIELLFPITLACKRHPVAIHRSDLML